MYRGSNTEEGKFYHRNFYGDEPFQRLDSDKRARAISDNYDLNNKIILDLGCNIGFFSMFANKVGAKKVIGVDYDKESIKFANKVKKDNKLININFLGKEINTLELERIGKVDCTFALAILPWIMHQTSREEMEEVINWMGENSNVNFIEIQYAGEPGELNWIHNDEECRVYLRKWFKYVYKVIKVTGWGPRTVWKCCNDVGEWKEIYRNSKTICSISSNCFFKKEKSNENFTFDNEVKYLSRVSDECYFPIILEFTDNTLLLSGFNAVNLETLVYEKHLIPEPNGLSRILFQLIGCLEDHNVKHQDINFENILISPQGTLFLVDFECATNLNGSLNNFVFDDIKKVDNVVMAKKVIDTVTRAQKFYGSDNSD